MPRNYEQEAIDRCFKLYLDFNGSQHDRIVTLMQEVHPGFSRQTMARWIKEYNWKETLKTHRKIVALAQLPTAERIAAQIDEVRDAVFEKGMAANWSDRDLMFGFARFAADSIAAHKVLRETRESLQNAVHFFEALLGILSDLAPDVHASIVEPVLFEEIMRRLKVTYGEKAES